MSAEKNKGIGTWPTENCRKGLCQGRVFDASRVKHRVMVDKFSQNQAFRAVNRRVDKMMGFTMGFMLFENTLSKHM